MNQKQSFKWVLSLVFWHDIHVVDKDWYNSWFPQMDFSYIEHNALHNENYFSTELEHLCMNLWLKIHIFTSRRSRTVWIYKSLIVRMFTFAYEPMTKDLQPDIEKVEKGMNNNAKTVGVYLLVWSMFSLNKKRRKISYQHPSTWHIDTM